ncbi:hypothetical protein Tco_0957422 [Tanacetum coccineum]|uniref:Uncharacterized protein n=1 Tax=Tanacetum coccineum TaxID=301880 RepID=A0ABQ5E4D8_9ASTR
MKDHFIWELVSEVIARGKLRAIPRTSYQSSITILTPKTFGKREDDFGRVSALTKDAENLSYIDEFERFRQIKGRNHSRDTTGLKESNFDQLYAYLKQHKVHANENRIMMERFIQPNNDPLALVSNASVQQYPTQYTTFPQSSKEPYPADKLSTGLGKSSTEN